MTGPVRRLWLILFPFWKREKVALLINWRTGGRIKECLVWATSAYGLGESVIDLKNSILGAIAAVCSLVLAFHDGKCLHDVLDSVTRGWKGSGENLRFLPPIIFCAKLQIEEGGIQLTAEKEASLLIPAERRAVVTAVLCEGFKVPSGVGEFHDASQQPHL